MTPIEQFKSYLKQGRAVMVDMVQYSYVHRYAYKLERLGVIESLGMSGQYIIYKLKN